MDRAPDSPLGRPLPRRSRAWLAAALTLFCPGWGHLYAGAVARGLLVALLNLAVIVPGVVWLWVTWAQGPWTALMAFGVTLAFLAGVPMDAARCALRASRALPPRRRRPLLVCSLMPFMSVPRPPCRRHFGQDEARSIRAAMTGGIRCGD